MRIRHFILASAVGLTFFLGCIYREEEPSPQLESMEKVTYADAGQAPQYMPPVEPSASSQSGGLKVPSASSRLKTVGAKPHLPQIDQSDVPTGLLIATCESEPPEIALPLDAADGKYCATVQPTAYREDDSGSHEVFADYTWQITDTSVAAFAAPPYGPGGCVRQLTAQYDAFSSPGDTWEEPQTALLVCAVPREGSAAQYPALCRTLPVRAVVNLESAWCFSGTSFQGSCDAMVIRQDGRYLYLDEWGAWNGEVKARSVTFSRGGYAYEGVLDSEEFMYGIVRQSGSQDVMGTWSAWKLPLF